MLPGEGPYADFDWNRHGYDGSHFLHSSSTVPLSEVTTALENALGLPRFYISGDEAVEHAESCRENLRFGISRMAEPGRGLDGIEHYPPDTTYTFTIFVWNEDLDVEDVLAVLRERCGMDIQVYASRSDWNAGPVDNSPLGPEVPSGWSPPFVWILILLILALVMVIWFWRGSG